MTTHYMDEAEYCNRVGIMRRGHLLAMDTPSALKRSALPGLAWDIIADPMLEALERLQALPFVSRAGLAADHLRAITGPDISGPMLSEALTREGIVTSRVESVEPTLEDVFLALAGE